MYVTENMINKYIIVNPIYNRNIVTCVCDCVYECMSDTLGTRQRKIQKIVK